jgi:site-specific recombinase XerD
MPEVRRALLQYVRTRAAVLRPKSVESLVNDLLPFAEYLTARHPGITCLRQLERGHIEGYLTWNRTRPWRGQRAAAGQDRVISAAVAQSAVLSLRNMLDDTFARIGLTVLRGAGLRVGELPDLEVGSIIDYGPPGTWLKVPLGKLATERMVPLDAATLAALDGHPASAPPHLGYQFERRDEPAGPDGAARARHPADDHPLRHPGLPHPARRL